jgi:large conductance mechanosensitive channel
VTGVLEEFREFIARGNVVDMAVGIAVGTAFAAIARSLVNDVIMPVAGLGLSNADFQDLFLVLRPGVSPGPYPSLVAAQEAGAVTLNYGLFLNSVVTFLIIAATVFLLVRTINRLRRREEGPPPPPSEQKCPFCQLMIPVEASRCPHCTSDLSLEGA